MEKTKTLCDGCRDDFYNGRDNCGGNECWLFKSAKVVNQWRLNWWTQPDSARAFQQVITLDCHHAPGRYAHRDRLPVFAKDPIFLKDP